MLFFPRGQLKFEYICRTFFLSSFFDNIAHTTSNIVRSCSTTLFLYYFCRFVFFFPNCSFVTLSLPLHFTVFFYGFFSYEKNNRTDYKIIEFTEVSFDTISHYILVYTIRCSHFEHFFNNLKFLSAFAPCIGVSVYFPYCCFVSSSTPPTTMWWLIFVWCHIR